jgi:hypothetical protein
VQARTRGVEAVQLGQFSLGLPVRARMEVKRPDRDPWERVGVSADALAVITSGRVKRTLASILNATHGLDTVTEGSA